MALPIPIGTWRVVWFGSAGPFYYDDGVDADDKELLYDGIAAPPQSAFVTDGQIDVASVPTLDPNVLRLVDVGVIVGDVVGPGASTDHALVRWDGATGKLIQDSGVIIDDSGNITVPDGAYIGQAAGPLVTFDNTNNYLEITGCNVGIGTTTPGAKLAIDGGSVLIGGAQNSYYGVLQENDINLNFGSAAGTEPRMYLYGSGNGQSNAGDIFIGTQSNIGDIAMYGNVGIGTTTPGSKLSVVGLTSYANNAAAIAGGLASGDFYKTGGNPDLVCVVT